MGILFSATRQKIKSAVTSLKNKAMADLKLDYEIKLRLKCLILANSDIRKAQEYMVWITTGVMPTIDRV